MREIKPTVSYDVDALLLKRKLTRHEAAFLLEVTPRTIDNYMNNGKIEYIRMPGGHRRPLTESVKRYL